jgi:aromatic-L-amino-acid/L-tryptophan decarboxylase
MIRAPLGEWEFESFDRETSQYLMTADDPTPGLRQATAPMEMSSEEFRRLGHRLVDQIAEFYAELPSKPVAPNVSVEQVRGALGERPVPERGQSPQRLLDQAMDLLTTYQRFMQHPRYWGYILGSAAPIGILGEFLAAAINANPISFLSSPMATEIERQTIRWLAEFIGYPPDCSGLMVSGGTMANFVGLLAARRARAPWDVRARGMSDAESRMMTLYVSDEGHTWVEKAADLFGLGTDAIRRIRTDGQLRLPVEALRRAIDEDHEAGNLPFLVVGSAGTVSTGAIDPLPEIAALCRERGLWFHVDAAYGGFAATLDDVPPDLFGLRDADSVALDAHKWLYVPLEAGCALVRDPNQLLDTFSYHAAYYHFQQAGGSQAINYYEYGPQNSREFRALKVWLALQQVGRSGYRQMIGDDIRLSRHLFALLDADPRFEARTQSLSIATFRYVPADRRSGSEADERYLNTLNEQLVTRLQQSGEAYVSNAIVDGSYLLRACITNFRSQARDIEALPDIAARIGAWIDREMKGS